MTESSQNPRYWLLDLRNVWPGTKIDDAAPHALSILTSAERTRARGFHFLKDAKLSVGSSLLKRLFATTRGIPWAEAEFGRRGDAKHGKPCLEAATDNGDVDFNVSHQAGLVALAGFSGVGKADSNTGPSTSIKSIGVDIVCVGERNDARSIQRSGFEGWIDMHVDVFSDADLNAMKTHIDGESTGGSGDVESEAMQEKLRRFYAYWALKEAYVKLEGEALLARWLREVEFKKVKIPRAAGHDLTNSSSIKNGDGKNAPAWGEITTGIEVWLRGKRREDVDLFLQAFDDNYMVATAIIKHDPAGKVDPPTWTVLDMERDIYPFAASMN